MELYVLRHGETGYNRLGLCNDDPRRPVHLTETGRAQAEGAARALQQAPVERIISSELPRARETAGIINRFHRLPIKTSVLLNDIRTGLDGQSVTAYFAATAADPLHTRVNGGESLLDHKARVIRFIEWLKAQPQQCVLVVAHEETLRVFDAWFKGLPDSDLRSLSFDNCAVQRYVL